MNGNKHYHQTLNSFLVIYLALRHHLKSQFMIRGRVLASCDCTEKKKRARILRVVRFEWSFEAELGEKTKGRSLVIKKEFTTRVCNPVLGFFWWTA